MQPSRRWWQFQLCRQVQFFLGLDPWSVYNICILKTFFVVRSMGLINRRYHDEKSLLMHVVRLRIASYICSSSILLNAQQQFFLCDWLYLLFYFFIIIVVVSFLLLVVVLLSKKGEETYKTISHHLKRQQTGRNNNLLFLQ